MSLLWILIKLYITNTFLIANVQAFLKSSSFTKLASVSRFDDDETSRHTQHCNAFKFRTKILRGFNSPNVPKNAKVKLSEFLSQTAESNPYLKPLQSNAPVKQLTVTELKKLWTKICKQNNLSGKENKFSLSKIIPYLFNENEITEIVTKKSSDKTNDISDSSKIILETNRYHDISKMYPGLYPENNTYISLLDDDNIDESDADKIITIKEAELRQKWNDHKFLPFGHNLQSFDIIQSLLLHHDEEEIDLMDLSNEKFIFSKENLTVMMDDSGNYLTDEYESYITVEVYDMSDILCDLHAHIITTNLYVYHLYGYMLFIAIFKCA
jgi:hypothetical protein